MKSFRFSDSDGILSGNTSPPPQRGTALSVTASPCQLSQRGSRGRFAPVLAPRIYEGGGPRSGRGSPPPQRGRLSQLRFACQLPQRGSRGRFAPFLPPAAAGTALSVTAAPCQLSQRESQGGADIVPRSRSTGGFPRHCLGMTHNRRHSLRSRGAAKKPAPSVFRGGGDVQSSIRLMSAPRAVNLPIRSS